MSAELTHYNSIYFLLFSYIIGVLIILLSNRVSKEKTIISIKILSYILLWTISLVLFMSSYIDKISLVFGSISFFIVIPVSIYTIRYTTIGKYPRNLSFTIDLFSILLITAFISPNILFFAISWTLAEFIGFYLVSLGEEHSIEGSTRASKRFLLMSAATFELTLFTMIYVSVFMLVSTLATQLNILDVLLKPYWELGAAETPLYLAPLLLVGFIAKSAQVPLHFWLPDAHSVAPAPASALLSGVMTAMGIYGILRVSMIASIGYDVIAYTLMFIGLISIIYGGLQSYVQRDGKRLLAYSTIAGNGFSIAILGYYLLHGGTEVFTALILSVAAHAGYKATLFLDIGLAEQVTGLRFIHRLRGLVKILPYSVLAGYLALFSIMGIPPTAGFISKLLAVFSAITGFPSISCILLILSIVSAIVTSILIGLRYIRIYYGEPVLLYSNPRTDHIRIMEYCTLVLSSSNLIFPLIILLYLEPMIYMILYVVSIPPLLVLIYSLYVMAKRT